MKSNRFIRSLASRGVLIALLLILLGLVLTTAFSQSSASAEASVRGTAKVEDTFVVDGVKIVAIPTEANGRPTGKPVPALVNKAGEYRIEDIASGSYELKAVGQLIKTKVLRTRILPGNSNVVNITLDRAPKRTRVSGMVLDSSGAPVRNAVVKIYSPDLPAAVCENCMLAESLSNQQGEIAYDDLGAQESYDFAVNLDDKTRGAGSVSVIAAKQLTLSAGPNTRVELRLSEGSNPQLTATLLPAAEAPIPKRGIELNRLEVATDVEPGKSNIRTIPSGEQTKIKGVVVRRDGETFVVRDINGLDTTIRLSASTSTQSGGGLLRSGTNYHQTEILRGLNVQVTGRGNTTGELVADKIRFGESDLRLARSVESRAVPLEQRTSTTESRLSDVEQNAQKLSGQLDELAAISNAARGGGKAAQDTADAAVAGVNATNDRVSALDDYVAQDTTAITFRVGSAGLSLEAKLRLDELAAKIKDSRGYVIEVSGFTDSTEALEKRSVLSQRRADTVIRYLVQNHNIPLRRIITPYGFGNSNPVADNTTRQGRAQNRRVEVKVLLNRGINEAPTVGVPKPSKPPPRPK
jgi:OOP family OmpA-OmpF porin